MRAPLAISSATANSSELTIRTIRGASAVRNTVVAVRFTFHSR